LISARALSFRYGAVEALDSVSVEIGDGELVAIVGANGSGKSTLTKLLARVLIPKDGEVYFRGRPTRAWNPREYAREVGYLPQDPEPAFSMSALEVVVSGRAPYLSRFAFESEDDYGEARRALKLCDASHLEGRPLEAMSGGEKQRVFLARVLAGQPRLVLLDEPFAGVDLAHTQSILGLLRSIVDARGSSVVFISHDLNWSAAYADRILVMDRGKLALDGTPRQVMDPEVIARHFSFRGEAIPATGRDHCWIVPSR
jgi:iron complex transport system ATP-binding protein